MKSSTFRRLALVATVFGLLVAVIGAFVRLTDAGLGCPDWPGCYGRLVVPMSEQAIATADQAFPERPVEVAKGWAEMIHRYLAGILGLMILALAIGAVRNRHDPEQPLVLPMALLALVIFQSVLGMWTVTWQLKPVIVMGHLLGGATTVGLLWWLAMDSGRLFVRPRKVPSGLRLAAVIGVVVLVGQIALGGWTSANYAALACTDFPTCHGEWWPETDFQEAFVLWRGIGMNYEFGVLDNPARTAIQMAHRIGAVVTLFVLLGVGLAVLYRQPQLQAQQVAVAIIALLLLQFVLGIANVLLSLPLPIAVAHNAVALILLLALISLNYVLWPQPRKQML